MCLLIIINMIYYINNMNCNNETRQIIMSSKLFYLCCFWFLVKKTAHANIFVFIILYCNLLFESYIVFKVISRRIKQNLRKLYENNMES